MQWPWLPTFEPAPGERWFALATGVNDDDRQRLKLLPGVVARRAGRRCLLIVPESLK